MKRNLASFGCVVSKSISEYSDKSDGVLNFLQLIRLNFTWFLRLEIKSLYLHFNQINYKSS